MHPDGAASDHRWPGFDATGSLLLHLPASFAGPGAGLAFTVNGFEFERKDEFHLTLLNRTQAEKIRSVLGEPQIAECFSSLRWYPQRSGEYWLIYKHKARNARPLETWSVIEVVSLPAMIEFIEQLSRLARVELAPPFPHLTHYVRGDRHGIGIESPSVFDELRVRQLPLAW